MSKWLELARRVFSETPGRLTDNTDDRTPTLLTSVTSVGHTGETEKQNLLTSVTSVGHTGETGKTKSSNVSNVSRSSGEIPENIFPDGLNPATLTADLPDDPTLRAEVHRLLDRADELSRAGDEVGMVRTLYNMRRKIQNAMPAQEAGKAPQADRVGKDEVPAATTQPRASNAKSSRRPDSVLVCWGKGVWK